MLLAGDSPTGVITTPLQRVVRQGPQRFPKLIFVAMRQNLDGSL